MKTQNVLKYKYLHTAHLVWQSYHSHWFDMEHTGRRILLLFPFLGTALKYRFSRLYFEKHSNVMI